MKTKDKIIAYLDKVSAEYYNGNPSISDEQFDALSEQFEYNKVGASSHETNQVKHFNRLYSLAKYYDGDAKLPLSEYEDREKVRSPKLDGAAVSALYVEGSLVRVLTRGDGVTGLDVTDKFLTCNVIPRTIRASGVIQIVGEVVAPKHIENSRNYASGSLSLKDADEFSTRAISFFAYSIFPNHSNSWKQDMMMLNRMGIETVLSPNLTDVYPTDGLVIRLDSYKEFNTLGHTSKFPRGAYAHKDKKESLVTELLDVIWQVGKSGKVTPVAILKPIIIDDAVITRATLNNGAFIEALQLYIGCSVGVVRAGEIIPQITHRVD